MKRTGKGDVLRFVVSRAGRRTLASLSRRSMAFLRQINPVIAAPAVVDEVESHFLVAKLFPGASLKERD